jgi:hypothetical protein
MAHPDHALLLGGGALQGVLANFQRFAFVFPLELMLP